MHNGEKTHPHNRASDQIFEGITWTGIGKVVGTILAVVTLAGIIIGAITASLVTKPELKAVKDSISANKDNNNRRFEKIETEQKELKANVNLIPGMARVQCLQLERDKSTTLARAARLPCDTL